VRRRNSPSQPWKTFLRNQAEAISAIDMCVVPTLTFDLFFAFLLGHGRRQLLWFEVTRHPTAEWLARQITEAFQVQVGKKTMRTHNSLLVSLPGADGMKTGFICESGFNVVASATRDRRKLVAVVLGEPSVASRNDRTTDLLESGFKRYFWKSLFGRSLDRLASICVTACVA